jgi:hypothetical protein
MPIWPRFYFPRKLFFINALQNGEILMGGGQDEAFQ